MEGKIKKSSLQLIDNYIKETSLKIHKKTTEKTNINLEMSVGISNIIEEQSILQTDLILKQNIKLYDRTGKELFAEIDASIVGTFVANNVDKEKFLEMIKYNGTPILSQILRSYIITVTSVAGMNAIRIPLINFVEFFNDEKEN